MPNTTCGVKRQQFSQIETQPRFPPRNLDLDFTGRNESLLVHKCINNEEMLQAQEKYTEHINSLASITCKQK